MFLKLRQLGSALFIAVFIMSGAAAEQTTLRVISWHMQGNGDSIDPKLLVTQLVIKQAVDIWGLCEVRPELFDDFLEGAKVGEQDEFDIVRGQSGKNIRLAIIYNKTKLEL